MGKMFFKRLLISCLMMCGVMHGARTYFVFVAEDNNNLRFLVKNDGVMRVDAIYDSPVEMMKRAYSLLPAELYHTIGQTIQLAPIDPPLWHIGLFNLKSLPSPVPADFSFISYDDIENKLSQENQTMKPTLKNVNDAQLTSNQVTTFLRQNFPNANIPSELQGTAAPRETGPGTSSTPPPSQPSQSDGVTYIYPVFSEYNDEDKDDFIMIMGYPGPSDDFSILPLVYDGFMSEKEAISAVANELQTGHASELIYSRQVQVSGKKYLQMFVKCEPAQNGELKFKSLPTKLLPLPPKLLPFGIDRLKDNVLYTAIFSDSEFETALKDAFSDKNVDWNFIFRGPLSSPEKTSSKSSAVEVIYPLRAATHHAEQDIGDALQQVSGALRKLSRSIGV